MNPIWETSSTPPELRRMLTALGRTYPVGQGSGGTPVRFERAQEPGVCEAALAAGTATVRFSTPTQAGRAVGALLSGLVRKGGVHRETTPFRTLGIMLDCSRNAVMTVEHIKTVWLPRLALLGYNMVMLYTEDTYQIPGEPYFGWKRGAYSAAELRTIVHAAAEFNIEVIPCIQTLGHLEQILKHGAYRPVRDTSSVLMVGEKKTYELIEKMIAHWSRICTTRRIHIGMDETHDLGRGRYLDMYGYRPGFDLFNEHLARVVKLCRKYRLKPMIWSDMYFRLGNKHQDYYAKSTVIPPRVVKGIPKDVELVYWDYYHDDPEFYRDWIERHRRLGKEPLMASGIWTWNEHWYEYRKTEANAGACVRACYDAKLQELIFTMWGDNGAYCDHDSAFAGMVFCADIAYGTRKPSADRLEARFGAVCGGSYAAHRLAGDLMLYGERGRMWDDPFFETVFRTRCQDNPRRMAHEASDCLHLARRLAPHAASRACGDMDLAHRSALAFGERYTLSAELLSAYRRKNRAALRIARRRIPRVRAAVRAMAAAFRRMWLAHNKPEGLEVIQGRFGMIDARYAEMDRSLGEFLAGEKPRIAELENHCPPG
jgi:hypothetical protein